MKKIDQAWTCGEYCTWTFLDEAYFSLWRIYGTGFGIRVTHRQAAMAGARAQTLADIYIMMSINMGAHLAEQLG